MKERRKKLSGWRLKPVRINLSGHMLNFTCGDFSTWPAELQVACSGYLSPTSPPPPLTVPLE